METQSEDEGEASEPEDGQTATSGNNNSTKHGVSKKGGETSDAETDASASRRSRLSLRREKKMEVTTGMCVCLHIYMCVLVHKFATLAFCPRPSIVERLLHPPFSCSAFQVHDSASENDSGLHHLYAGHLGSFDWHVAGHLVDHQVREIPRLCAHVISPSPVLLLKGMLSMHRDYSGRAPRLNYAGARLSNSIVGFFCVGLLNCLILAHHACKHMCSSTSICTFGCVCVCVQMLERMNSVMVFLWE